MASTWDREAEARLARVDRRQSETLPLVLVGSGAERHFRHEELWYEDGNVVVISQNVWFKLHRSILAKHSRAFRDMFHADAFAGDIVEGCPAVTVADSPQHLALFFKVLYDPTKQPFFMDQNSSMDFRDLRALTLLSFKYDVPHIRAEALRRLRICYPATLEEWHLRYPEFCAAEPGSPRKKRALDARPVDAIAAINLARRFALHELLPAAFSVCLTQSPEFVMAQVCYGAEDVEELSREDLVWCYRSSRSLCASCSNTVASSDGTQ
ncbi:hypothetical protein PHLGIDRAFT_279464 [Phlebiopsis gigantea 11061_1 CR5-6]|uniref:BTB domain-containing protein n=1 Tax=Phlebiopsis gigantea (strain 11061_1 CR5-6) TaxID=745531 RepID=A0A0C3RRL8_PHLG1|nr:hypothetical protein PHLGIDRAFT_279464 [Phlebiopsis gigantea 11061_1 CR5-6]